MATNPTSPTETSKSEMLRRIQAATGGNSTLDAAQSDWNTIARNYNRSSTRSPHATLDLFADRLRDYDATVVWSDHRNIAQTIARILQGRSKRRIAIPPGLAAEWLPEGFDFIIDDLLPATALDQLDGVLTAATLAIAETGTVVLQNVPGQGRRALSLVPDYHLCIVCAEDVVDSVPQAMQHLHATAALPTTFISGPSATADIEMTRIKGVHGPRTLDVVLFSETEKA